jgi:hypothetical protein
VAPLSESRKRRLDRFQRREGTSNEWGIGLYLFETVSYPERCGMATTLVVDPVCNFLAGSGQSDLTRVEECQQCGDGLFFGHLEHLR